jgi:endonuclease/exonuclease/phosphatase (EEP) superfamily protein YafD
MTEAPVRQAALRRLLVILAATATVGLGAATLLAFAARHGWRLELLTHFRAHYFWLLVVAAVVLAATRHLVWALAAAGLAVVNLVFVAPLYFGPERDSDGLISRAMSLNVRWINRDHRRTLDLVATEDPDFVLFLEVTPEWAEALASLNDRYPYSQVVPKRNSAGVAFYSRVEVEDMKVEYMAYNAVTIVAHLKLPSGRLAFIGIHPSSPTSPENFEYRNRELSEVGKLAASLTTPLMLMGDLNTTGWSPYFSDLLNDSGLLDSRRGFGIEGTWPKVPFPLRIPIDHCLVSPDIMVVDRRVGPDVGSDHRPIVVDFTITPR